MLTGDTSSKQINFSASGLNILEMGSKISTKIKPDLIDINISTTEGFKDYISINNSYYLQEGYIYKKLISKKYVFQGMENIPFDLLLAISPKGEIKAIQINFKRSNNTALLGMLNNVYGKHNAEIHTEYSIESKNVAYESLFWSYSDFQIRFSDSEIRIYYDSPMEYTKKLLQQGDN